MHCKTISSTVTRCAVDRHRQPLVLLGLGAFTGLLCAVLVLLGESPRTVADAAAVATVNGTRLEMAEYERALRLFTSEKRSVLTPADRALVLERMVEEELLLQHGIELGLVRNDPAVRAEVLRAVLGSLMADLEAGAGDRGDSSDREAERNDRLADYLARLRDSADIRRVATGANQ